MRPHPKRIKHEAAIKVWEVKFFLEEAAPPTKLPVAMSGLAHSIENTRYLTKSHGT